MRRDRSEVDDINLGLQHFYGDFNVAHARLVSSGVSDLPMPIASGALAKKLPLIRSNSRFDTYLI